MLVAWRSEVPTSLYDDTRLAEVNVFRVLAQVGAGSR
jgi:hypothetical protein